jgi:dTDP-4-dehydrorhamnose reductase
VDLVRDVSIEEMNFSAPRPKDTSLNIIKAETALRHRWPGILEGLKRFRELRESGFVDSLKAGLRMPHN